MNDNDNLDDELGQLPEAAIHMEEALDLLESLTGDEETMTLSEVNGFLCGIAACPEAIAEDEWLPEIWGRTEHGDKGPFESPEQAEQFRAVVRAYHASVVEELAQEDFQPIFEADGEDEEADIIWELWVLGFTRAYIIRMAAWQTYLESADEDTSDAMMQMIGLMAIADPDPEEDADLDEEDLAEIEEAAPDVVAYSISVLYHARQQQQ